MKKISGMQGVDYENDLEDNKLIDDGVIQEQKKLQGSPNYTAPKKKKKQQLVQQCKAQIITQMKKKMQKNQGVEMIEIEKMQKAMNQKYLGFSTENTPGICDFIRESNKQMRFKFRKHIRKYGKIKGNGILYGFTSKKKIMTFFRRMSKYSYRKLYKSAMSKGLISINTNSTRIFLTMKQMENLIILQKFKITLKGLFRSARIQALQILEQKFLNEFNGNQLEFQQYINQLLSQKKLIEKKILKGKTYNQARTTLPSFDFTACYFIRQKTHLIQLRQKLHKGADWPIINLQFPNNQQQEILHENHQPINQQPVYYQQSESSSYLPIQTFIIPYVPQDVEIDFDQFNHIYNHDSSDI